jgi:hypothetical protein
MNTAIRKHKKGQMLLVFALTWALLLAGILMVFNTGTLVGERIRLQQISDNAAYSGAVWQARCLNYLAYCNRAIVADLAFIAYLNAVVSHFGAWSEVLTYLQIIASLIPYAGAIISQIIQVIQQIMDTIADIVEEIKNSGLWELVMESIYITQQGFVFYTENTTEEVMKQIALEADPNVLINQDSDVGVINKQNFQALYKDAKGEGEKISYVTSLTISPWTSGDDTGMIPLGNRDWHAFPDEVEEALKLLGLLPGPPPFPSQIGINGEVAFDGSGITTKDNAFAGFWDYDYPDPLDLLDGSVGWEYSEIPLSTTHTEEREVDWDDIGFYNFKNAGPRSAGVYVVAEKPWSTMPELIFKKILGGTFAGSADAMAVPKNDLKVISKAITVYEDPEVGSSRSNDLIAANKDPNLWNPFWHAELVAINSNMSGIAPYEDENPANSENMLDSQFGSAGGLPWEMVIAH